MRRKYDSGGRPLLDGRLVPLGANYRAYLLPWTATPATPPSVSASTRGGHTVLHASWNGATEVASWRVLAGDSAASLAPVATAKQRGFETEIEIEPHRYVAVEALDRAGHTLAKSTAAKPS